MCEFATFLSYHSIRMYHASNASDPDLKGRDEVREALHTACGGKVGSPRDLPSSLGMYFA